jgi:hypothetical protein
VPSPAWDWVRAHAPALGIRAPRRATPHRSSFPRRAWGSAPASVADGGGDPGLGRGF